MSTSGRRFSVQVPDWGQDHLSAEAIAAYVDGELGERPYDRATRHLANCSECAAQVVAQGQARAALRSARIPRPPTTAALERYSPDAESEREPSLGPIIGKRRLRQSEVLRYRPTARAHVGLVVMTLSGEYRAFPPEMRLTLSERYWKSGATLYEVDTGRHTTSIELDVPSRSPAFSFHAIVELEWRVTDLVQVVKHEIRNIPKTLEPYLWQRLSATTRRFEIMDGAAAEREATMNLNEHTIGGDIGLATRAFIRLRMEAFSVHHTLAVRDTSRTVGQEYDKRALDVVHERYREIVESGDAGRVALQLARDPDETSTVLQMMLKYSDNRRNVSEFVSQVLDSGAIDRYAINDQVRDALQLLKEATERLLASGPNASAAASPTG